MSEDFLASVVIPVWRDEEALARTLGRYRTHARSELIVAAALGEEPRYQALRNEHPSVRWIAAPRGRASQMNAGAAIARGRWLLFLHADSELPSDWLDVMQRGDTSGLVAGSFRLALDSPDWRARVVEGGVRLRVLLLGLPYGDQALFVRRSAFEAIGGFRDLPLMEDIDFVRRIRQRGRMLHASSRVLTSARRWEREGWLGRSARNIGLATRFLCGTSPARLAQKYYDRRPRAIILLARAPSCAGKTRIDLTTDERAHAALREALFLDTLDAIRAVSDVDPIIACEPQDACEKMRALAGAGTDVIAQRGDGLGARMQHAFEDVFRLGAEAAILIGSDLPDLPSELLRNAFATLAAHPHAIVLGPAADGGYYLIGMTRPNPAVFAGIDWSTNRVLEQTLDAAERQGVKTVLLEPWADVDRMDDVIRIAGAPAGTAAARTRAWAEDRLRG